MGLYPRQIKLDDKTKSRLARYIDEELTRHYAERQGYVDNIKTWQIDYWAEPSSTTLNFPFQNAANIIIPLAAITVEAIHSRVMTTMFALSQFTAAKPVSPKWSDHARPVERFLDAELVDRIGIYRPINDAVLETIKYGTGYAKDGFERIEKTAMQMIGDKEKEVKITTKNNATVTAVPAGKFLMPFVYQDPQEASWCGEEHKLTPYQVRQLEISGLFREDTVRDLSAHYTTSPANTSNSGASVEQTQEELENKSPTWPEHLDIVELWMGFDVDNIEDSINDGLLPREIAENSFDKEIVVHYHRDSGQFLSCRYNWNEDLRRPYHVNVYFPVEHRGNGIGVCKQVEQFQKEITTQHRQRIDNATIANCRMLKISNLSKYGPDEPIFPGKMWFVDNPNDIETFQLGEVYSSSYSNENQALLYVQQRTGVNEVNLGMPQSGTPGTATSDLARIQEGNKKFDFTYRNTKQFATSVTRATVLNIKQFGPRASVYYEAVEGGQLVKEFFSQDFNLIKHGMLLEISVAGQQDNKLLDRNNWQQVAQIVKGYYTDMVTLAQAKGDPNLLANIINKGMTAATETVKQILESYDLKNVDRIILEEALLNGKLAETGSLPGATSGPANVGAPAGIQLPPNGVPPV